MEKEKFSVRYCTRTGHTKQIAEEMAAKLGCRAISVTEPLTEYPEVLFLGGAVYAGKLDSSLTAFIDRLDPKQVGKVVIFADATLSDPRKKIRAALEKKGITPEADDFYCKGSFKAVSKGRPNADDLKNAADFAGKWLQ